MSGGYDRLSWYCVGWWVMMAMTDGVVKFLPLFVWGFCLIKNFATATKLAGVDNDESASLVRYSNCCRREIYHSLPNTVRYSVPAAWAAGMYF